jgi:hypothetical protein
MAFSEVELKRIDGIAAPLCRRRSPVHASHQVRTEYRVKGHDVLIVEVRLVRDDPTKWMEYAVAKIRFNRSAVQWRLLWQRASGRIGAMPLK